MQRRMAVFANVVLVHVPEGVGEAGWSAPDMNTSLQFTSFRQKLKKLPL